MGLVGLILCLCFLQFSTGSDVAPLLHSDAGLDAIELITKYGYPVEQHWVTTSDGYILALHRIPYGSQNEGVEDKPPVLLVHGLGSSSADFVNMGPDKSISFLLADQGYDVWLLNVRGNSWSRNHTTLDPNEDSDYWRFSWNEIGVHDLPTSIDYILQVSGQEKLFYIGHGQGNTAFFVMASDLPEYNAKIRAMAALSPSAYMLDLVSPIFRILAPYCDLLETVFNLLGIYEIGPRIDILLQFIAVYFCDDGNPYQDICADVIYMFNGYSFNQMNPTMIPVIFSNYPDGAGLRQYVHYAQLTQSARFRKFDFGMTENLNAYGQTTPPDYSLSLVTTPVAVFYAANDWMSSTASAERLARDLPNVVLLHQIENERFNHIDYLFGIDAKSLVYDYIFELFEEY